MQLCFPNEAQSPLLSVVVSCFKKMERTVGFLFTIKMLMFPLREYGQYSSRTRLETQTDIPLITGSPLSYLNHISVAASQFQTRLFSKIIFLKKTKTLISVVSFLADFLAVSPSSLLPPPDSRILGNQVFLFFLLKPSLHLILFTISHHLSFVSFSALRRRYH